MAMLSENETDDEWLASFYADCDFLNSVDSLDSMKIQLYGKPRNTAINAARRAQAQTGADEAREALDKNPELKRLIEVLHERGVKFDKSMGSGEINEHMLEPKFFGLRNSRIHLAEDGVTLVWPVAFIFVDLAMMHFEFKVEEKTTMKNLLRKIMSVRPIARATKLNLQKCDVYYQSKPFKPLRKVNVKKSIKDIVDEQVFIVSGGCLTFFVYKENQLA